MKRWWALFYLGAGGALTFAYLTRVLDDWPGPGFRVLYYWPIVSALFCGLAVVRLRRFNFLRENREKGVWHLSISDLLVSSFVVSALFAISRAAQRNDVFVRVCVPGSIFGGVLFVMGLLTANRMEIKNATAKFGYACGFLLKTFGLLAIGATVSTLIVILILDRSSDAVFRFCWDILMGSQYEDVLCRPLRVGIAVLPIGYLFCWRASRTRAQPISQAPQT